MSSLNINDLYETSNNKNIMRLRIFDDVLKKIHTRIKYNATHEKMYCFYQIPEFIIGVPLYDINDLQKYLINSLKKDGFRVLYVEPNWLFINWETIQKKSKIKLRPKYKKDNFKLIDEYKPSGNFYNDNDLSSIKYKTEGLL
tara:strand:+ start:2232 stop:2657 length:426 start_codon:yes stop_codon:yes gene_type:complete